MTERQPKINDAHSILSMFWAGPPTYLCTCKTGSGNCGWHPEGPLHHPGSLNAVLELVKESAGYYDALKLIARSSEFNGGTSVDELQGIARVAIARSEQ